MSLSWTTRHARCVRDYAEHDLPKMRVCGACGLRCPMTTYEALELDSIKEGYFDWLCVDDVAYGRLCNKPPLQLIRRTGAGPGGLETVAVPQKLLYNLTEVEVEGERRALHLIPEAIEAIEARRRVRRRVYLCSSCHHPTCKTKTAAGQPQGDCGRRSVRPVETEEEMAQRLDDEIVANGAPLEPEDTEETDDVVANGAPLTEETEEPEADRFDDLYSTKAPK